MWERLAEKGVFTTDYFKKRISKGNGRYRLIYKPDAYTKYRLLYYVDELNLLALQTCPPGVVHGFWRARSPVSNAARHVGYQYTVSFDLTDFFDSCTSSKLAVLKAVCHPSVFERLLPDGAARQGLPTSPPISNIAAAELDRTLLSVAAGAAYTRYADDLTFSCNDRATVERLLLEVPQAIVSHGFIVNRSKTKVQSAAAGRRVITGLAVDDAVHAPRRMRRLLRAAKFIAAMPTEDPRLATRRQHRLAGLASWCQCKLPKYGKKSRSRMKDAQSTMEQMAAGAKYR